MCRQQSQFTTERITAAVLNDLADRYEAIATTMKSAGMKKQRIHESAEERHERVKREAQDKSDEAAADDRAVDEMIRRNIELYGP